MESDFKDQKLDITPLITPEIKLEGSRIFFTFKMVHILEQIIPVTDAFLPENGRKLEITVNLDGNDDFVILAARGSAVKVEGEGDVEMAEVIL